jgi:hypothetical protein
MCDVTTIAFFNIFLIINMSDTITIPFIIMSVSSVLTIRKLFKSRYSVERNGKMATERRSRDHKYAISSMILNVMFIILKTPRSYFFHTAGFLFLL